eukprot:TRINITY_DN11184_c0_g2_i1.p1 TRINITY_DN11184_c0_g2~~TRINITY_DN11184_c0_g2_i1.p1  ORF type:complete len:261 (+),score=53.99 TRINITY_DN11184_c0_g2_i1:110-892(+)
MTTISELTACPPGSPSGRRTLETSATEVYLSREGRRSLEMSLSGGSSGSSSVSMLVQPGGTPNTELSSLIMTPAASVRSGALQGSDSSSSTSSSAPSTSRAAPQADSANRDAAATKIQALYRAWRVRRSLKTNVGSLPQPPVAVASNDAAASSAANIPEPSPVPEVSSTSNDAATPAAVDTEPPPVPAVEVPPTAEDAATPAAPSPVPAEPEDGSLNSKEARRLNRAARRARLASLHLPRPAAQRLTPPRDSAPHVLRRV